jgi:hypothetical protein
LHFKISVSGKVEPGCKRCKSKTNLLILEEFKKSLNSCQTE